MLGPVVSVIWFGFRAFKKGRNVIVWALAGGVIASVADIMIRRAMILYWYGLPHGGMPSSFFVIAEGLTAILTIFVSFLLIRPASKGNQSESAGKSKKVLPEKKWFTEPSQRGGPLTPADFNLFEVPCYPLNLWAQAVASEPWRVCCTIVQISALGNISKTLFNILKQKYDITPSECVDILNVYLGAACPDCFGGLTGEMLQTVETGKNAAGALYYSADPGFQRVMKGTCATCSSKKYYVIWHGDRKTEIG